MYSDWNKSQDNLDIVRAWAHNAPTNPAAESLLRTLLANAVGVCPVAALVRFGEVLVACQEEEMRRIAAAN